MASTLMYSQHFRRCFESNVYNGVVRSNKQGGCIILAIVVYVCVNKNMPSVETVLLHIQNTYSASHSLTPPPHGPRYIPPVPDASHENFNMGTCYTKTVQIVPPSLVLVAWAKLGSIKHTREFFGELDRIRPGMPVVVVGGHGDGEVNYTVEGG